jgi:hypothetical protein
LSDKNDRGCDWLNKYPPVTMPTNKKNRDANIIFKLLIGRYGSVRWDLTPLAISLNSFLLYYQDDNEFPIKKLTSLYTFMDSSQETP